MEKLDSKLIQKCKQGDILAKGWLYDTYAPVLLGICRRYLPDKVQAEDVLHESFIVVFDKIKDLKDEHAVVAWMKRIVVNNALKQLKNQHNFYAIDEINETTIEETDSQKENDLKEQILALNISQQDMLKIINELPTGFCAVFNLYVFEKYKHDEIAKELGISAATSRSQLLRARKLIQKRLFSLVQEKKKMQKEEKVLLSSLLLFMNNDLNYIDKLAIEILSNYYPTPPPPPSFTIKGSNQANAISSGLKQKLIIITSKKIIWIPTLLVGISAITLFTILTQKTEPETIQQTIQDASTNPLNIIDTLNMQTEIENENNINNNTIEGLPTDTLIAKKDTIVKKEVIHRTVTMKKVVTVKKKQVITDTIKK